MTYETTFDKGQRVRRVNETRPRRITAVQVTSSGEWYQLNCGASWWPADSLRVVFDDDRDSEQESTGEVCATCGAIVGAGCPEH